MVWCVHLFEKDDLPDDRPGRDGRGVTVPGTVTPRGSKRKA